MTQTKNILASTVLTAALALQGTIAGAQGTSHPGSGPAQALNLKSTESIRPFKVQISNAAIKDLRKRVLETRWPDKETVADQSQAQNFPNYKVW